MAYKSRSKRASESAGEIRDVAIQLRGLIEDVDPEKSTDEKKEEIIDEANNLIQRVDDAEIEALKEEICSWRDNMEGTNLENTSKYQEVSECADMLEDIEIDNGEIEDLSDIESRADDFDEAADSLEEVMFPGMY